MIARQSDVIGKPVPGDKHGNLGISMKIIIARSVSEGEFHSPSLTLRAMMLNNLDLLHHGLQRLLQLPARGARVFDIEPKDLALGIE